MKNKSILMKFLRPAYTMLIVLNMAGAMAGVIAISQKMNGSMMMGGMIVAALGIAVLLHIGIEIVYRLIEEKINGYQ